MARPLSLQARSLAAASCVLAAFLGLAFFALDRAFYDAAESALRERLQGYIFAYLAAADTTRSGSLENVSGRILMATCREGRLASRAR